MDSKEFALQFKEVWELAMSFSKIAQREGLLALEEVLDYEKAAKRDIVHFGLRFVVDGTEDKIIDSILTNIINLETDEYVKTLKTIQKEAVLGILSGMNPRMLAHLLNSYVDNETVGVFEEDKNIKPLKAMANNALFREEIDTSAFSEMILALDDRAVQKILREIDNQVLAKALKGCGEAVMEKVSKSVSRMAFIMLKEDMEYMGPIRLRDVEKSQEKILSIIKHLEDTGEIVISRATEEELKKYE